MPEAVAQIPLYDISGALLRWISVTEAERHAVTRNRRGRIVRARVRPDSPWVELRIQAGYSSGYGTAYEQHLDSGHACYALRGVA